MPQILIVDDRAANLQLVAHELKKAGYEVVAARSGAEALSRARESLPDAILLDVVMPEMDGFETCRRFKADPELCAVPVLMWTSLDRADDIVRGLEAGAQDFVTKPIVSEVLRARLRSVLRAKQDRDELIDANEQLDASRRAAKHALNVRNEFLSHVSHELRTPLSTLHQFLTIVLDGLAGDLTPEQMEYLGICLRNAKQLRSMIADLMDVTRVQNGKLRITPQPIELEPVVHDVVRAQECAAQAKGVSLISEVEDLPSVLADDGRVRQVLSNLIDNAIKYTPEGGTITVTAGPDAATPRMVRLSVQDTGCGVTDEARERIFEYMQQDSDDDWRSRKGLGIGLYICKELVTRQGGQIWVEGPPKVPQTLNLDHPPPGSTFAFTLPEFDLTQIIATAIHTDGRLRDVFSLIRVDLSPADPGSSRGVPETLSRRAYHLIQACLYPEDVLLPRFFRTGLFDTYFAVVGSDEVGMQSLRRRVRNKLAGKLADLSRTDESGVRIEVRGRVERLDAVARERPDAADEVARIIERATQIDNDDTQWCQ